MNADTTPRRRAPAIPWLILTLTLVACGDGDGGGGLSSDELAATPPPAALADGPELEWDDLIPTDWRPDKLFEDYDVGNLEDDDPRADALMDQLETLWAEAPVVPELDGHRVKLPGFVVPLTTDAAVIREFLLVPYFGACIHVPPPPPNQTVHVVTSDDGAYRGELFDTVWVEGTMRVEQFTDDLGSAGYRIDAVRVSAYEEEP